MEKNKSVPVSNRNVTELMIIIQRNDDTYCKRLLEYAAALEKVMKKGKD